MKKSKILIVAMIFTMVFALGACEKQTTKDDSDATPVYVAVTEPTFPPFDTTNENGDIIGFDMDLMDAIGDLQGFEVKYKAMEFDSLIPALQSGSADMITAGMNAEDPERQAKVDFSDTYYDSGLVVLVREDEANVGGIDTLTKDMKVASQIGTTGADKANELAEEGKIKEAVILNGFDMCIQQLKSKTVDAVIVDKPVGDSYMKKQPGVIKAVGNVINAEAYGFAVTKGNKELLEKINEGLEILRENGTYDRLYKKWFEE